MSNKLYDTMILVPEHEYLILKEQNQRNQNKNLPIDKKIDPSYTKLPGLAPEKLEQSSFSGTNKEEISSNWAILWVPL